MQECSGQRARVRGAGSAGIGLLGGRNRARLRQNMYTSVKNNRKIDDL